MNVKKRILFLGILAFGSLQVSNLNAQECGYASGLGCANTDYNNYGTNTIEIDNPVTIEYDNFISAFHSTIVRTFGDEFKVWGEHMASNGSGNHESVTSLNASNYPGLTGTVLKATLASQRENEVQALVLTTTGLFAWGDEGYLLDGSVTDGKVFQKIQQRSNNIGISGANEYGLPTGVTPMDVKMLFGTSQSLAIVTCDGLGFVLSKRANNRANGAIGNNYTWSQVQTAANTPLTDIIAIRGSQAGLIAFTKNAISGVEKLYTWGSNTYLGNGSPAADQVYATEMTKPSASGNIKMVGGTFYGSSHASNPTANNNTFYVLYTDGNIYALGRNDGRQLGDWTTDERTSWIQPRYESTTGTPITNIAWISPNEHDAYGNAGIMVVTVDGKLVSWGVNSRGMLGHGDTGGGNPGVGAVNPNNVNAPLAGLDIEDKVISVETGGHTSMISKDCEEKFGYIGHFVRGSAASSGNGFEYDYTFTTTPLQICGALTVPAITHLGSPTKGPAEKYCNNTTLTLVGTPAGGVFEYVSGSGTLVDHVLTLGGSGQVEVKYTVATDCGEESSTTRIYEIEDCTLYEISGTVWHDKNSDAIQDTEEPGTNAEIPPINDDAPVWVNLIDENGLVISSKQVNPDGTYSFSAFEGTYDIQLSATQFGTHVKASSLPASYLELPGDWTHTGTNVDNTPNTTNQSGKIFNVTVSATSTATGNNFGIRSENTILPVNIVNFTAHLDGSASILKWVTATERNNKGFEVQHNANGKEWNTIGFVNSKAINGNHSGNMNYDFKHDKPLVGSNYYRLKQIDFDGQIEITPIRVVTLSNKSDVQIYPNPAKEYVIVDGLNSKAKIHVVNAVGQEVIKEITESSTLKLHINSLPSGMYYIHILQDGVEVQVEKVMITK